MMPTRALLGLTLATALARTPASSAAQTAPSADAARYAARRERAYDRLGPNVLVVQSRWRPAQENDAAFDQDPTFFYYTGDERLIGALLVLDGATRRAEVFLPNTPPRGLAGLSQAGLGVDRAASLHVSSVSGWTEFEPYVEKRLAENPRLTIHVDDGSAAATDAGTVSTPLDSLATPANPPVAWLRALRRRWPNATVVPDTFVSVALRAVKDSAEVSTLRRVAAASVSAFLAGLPRFGAGRRQREVEAAAVDACTRAGDGPSFWPWVMSGPNAVFPKPFTSFLAPHHLDRQMQAGEVVRYDLGCKLDHYMGDVGRTLPVTGTFTPGQREVIDLMAAAYRAGLATIRDGADAEGLLRAGVAEAKRRQAAMRTPLGRHAAALMAQPDSLPYWQWHGVGLADAEEPPRVLRSGMVIAYEPIFVVEGQGFYMEDMILVTPSGHEILTAGLPSTAAEIERAMRRRR
jgi:Xaa-Pro aminopeptidase